jgi:hypothetical protein
MAQIFSRRFVLLLKLSTLAALGAIVTAIIGWRIATGVRPAIAAPVAQPVPFSHKHHVGDDGFDCRYCHSTVETSAFAGMPSTRTCMGCHQYLFPDAPILAPVRESLARNTPLRWNRVHELPGFVYFDHSIHVAKGVGCTTCHGAIDRMPLTWRAQSLEMQWCLDCHRAPGRWLRPRDQVFALDWPVNKANDDRKAAELLAANGVRTTGLTDCSTCHR